MAPRKPKKVVLSDVIASACKWHREQHKWTQEQVAEKMREQGFANWARTTVTEVEGSGRRRQVSVPELLGLAIVFGCGLDALLWDEPHRLEIVPGGVTLDKWGDFLSLLMSTETLDDALARTNDKVVGPMLEREYTRMSSVMVERVQAVVAELRGTAAWFETEALAGLFRRQTEETKS